MSSASSAAFAAASASSASCAEARRTAWGSVARVRHARACPTGRPSPAPPGAAACGITAAGSHRSGTSRARPSHLLRHTLELLAALLAYPGQLQLKALLLVVNLVKAAGQEGRGSTKGAEYQWPSGTRSGWARGWKESLQERALHQGWAPGAGCRAGDGRAFERVGRGGSAR